MFESLKICMYFGEVVLLSVHIKHEFFFFLPHHMSRLSFNGSYQSIILHTVLKLCYCISSFVEYHIKHCFCGLLP